MYSCLETVPSCLIAQFGRTWYEMEILMCHCHILFGLEILCPYLKRAKTWKYGGQLSFSLKERVFKFWALVVVVFLKFWVFNSGSGARERVIRCTPWGLDTAGGEQTKDTFCRFFFLLDTAGGEQTKDTFCRFSFLHSLFAFHFSNILAYISNCMHAYIQLSQFVFYFICIH